MVSCCDFVFFLPVHYLSRVLNLLVYSLNSQKWLLTSSLTRVVDKYLVVDAERTVGAARSAGIQLACRGL